MKTTIHTYAYNTDVPSEAKAYAELCETLQSKGMVVLAMTGEFSHVKGTIDTTSKELNGREIELETEHLFNNQWNTGPIEGVSDLGLRVFDWYESINFNNRSLKIGHYLDVTPAMKDARRDRFACGYCGRQEPGAIGNVFCGQCIDSEYLKESELYLTRMQSVALGMRARKPLSEEESDRLMPEYRHAQIHGKTDRGVARLKKERADIEAKWDRAMENANRERDGMIWLLDRGVKLDNVIFYDHTGRFAFGWRSPMSGDVKAQFLAAIDGFPFLYDFSEAKGY